MIRYSLAELGRSKTRRDSARLPGIHARLGTERAYEAALGKMLRDLARFVRTYIIPAYTTERRMTRDVDDDMFDRMRAIAQMMANEASAMATRILTLEAERHTEQFRATVKTAIGVDINAVVRQEDLGDYIRRAAARNTSLIKSLADDVVKQVEQTVIRNLLAGKPASELRKELTERFGVGLSRAKLIARDQTAKINSDLNRIRQEQAGVQRYDWSTSHDERVRPRHKALDGNRYEWGKATGAEQGLPPGQPIHCFTGSNRFFSDHDVSRLFRYRYSGELTRIIANTGETLETTPNHPMLTRSGWKRAESLNVGDEIVQIDNAGLFRRDMNVKHRHATFAQSYEFFRSFGENRHKGLSRDFYGDGPVDDDIYIVNFGEFGLRRDDVTETFKQIGQFILAETLVCFPNLTCARDDAFVFDGSFDSANRIVRGLREVQSFLIAQSGHTYGVRLTSVAEFESATLDFVTDRFPLASVVLGQGQDGFAFDVVSDHFRSVEVLRILRWSIYAWNRETATLSERGADCAPIVSQFGSDFVQTSAGSQFGYCTIENIVRDTVHNEWVYTAETQVGWYLAGNAVARNCRCVALAVIEF